MIAWSGAGLATYSVPDEVVAEDPEVPLWLAELEVPMDITLFDRQVAADNSSMVSNFSSWVPQVSCMHALARLIQIRTRHSSLECVTWMRQQCGMSTLRSVE